MLKWKLINWQVLAAENRHNQSTVHSHRRLFVEKNTSYREWLPWLCSRRHSNKPSARPQLSIKPASQFHVTTQSFNSPLSGTTRVRRYEKVKPIWILLKQETVSGSGISWAICKSAPRSRQITTPAPHHSVFYRPDDLPPAQPTASKHWMLVRQIWHNPTGSNVVTLSRQDMTTVNYTETMRDNQQQQTNTQKQMWY